ncbi:sulfurtransferase complex subunit TusB [Marinobacter lipolyticus]|uniref:sulfurtransferase complex subunit TusB n=1 Tax=Marinobacter lipolyticus TaxID=209639 RepID=UPI001BCF6A33|nr:sulfurtransferase complex subunit TusB [Marinobacter lipolyticus]MBS8239084.1 sulfurtransferase complex subunit TusB [Marinobacter lipolyticus]
MHTLHIVSKAPGHRRFRECLGMVGDQDAILLTGNGVIAIADTHIQLPDQVYALTDDLQARALADKDQVPHNCTAIDFETMVELSIQAQRVVSW